MLLDAPWQSRHRSSAHWRLMRPAWAKKRGKRSRQAQYCFFTATKVLEGRTGELGRTYRRATPRRTLENAQRFMSGVLDESLRNRVVGKFVGRNNVVGILVGRKGGLEDGTPAKIVWCSSTAYLPTRRLCVRVHMICRTRLVTNDAFDRKF